MGDARIHRASKKPPRGAHEMKTKLFAEDLERRDKVQILADIIKVSEHEAKITRILRLANIQYNTFQECIDTLCNSGLLERVELPQTPRSFRDLRTKYAYKATQMGIKWCEMIDEIYKTLVT